MVERMKILTIILSESSADLIMGLIYCERAKNKELNIEDVSLKNVLDEVPLTRGKSKLSRKIQKGSTPVRLHELL